MKIKGLSEAVQVFNENPNAVRIYFDKEKLEVWANIYADGNSWDDYHNQAIIEVARRSNYPLNTEMLTVGTLRYRCSEVLKVGDGY